MFRNRKHTKCLEWNNPKTVCKINFFFLEKALPKKNLPGHSLGDELLENRKNKILSTFHLIYVWYTVFQILPEKLLPGLFRTIHFLIMLPWQPSNYFLGMSAGGDSLKQCRSGPLFHWFIWTTWLQGDGTTWFRTREFYTTVMRTASTLLLLILVEGTIISTFCIFSWKTQTATLTPSPCFSGGAGYRTQSLTLATTELHHEPVLSSFWSSLTLFPACTTFARLGSSISSR